MVSPKIDNKDNSTYVMLKIGDRNASNSLLLSYSFFLLLFEE